MTSAYGEETYRNGVKITGCAMEMSGKYKDYSYSQLTEMLPLSDEQRAMISPDMTIKQIREIKKNGKAKTVESADLVATSQPDNLLDMTKYSELYGVVLYNMIKKADRIRPVVLEIFDCNGKPVTELYNVWVDFLGMNSDHIVIRMREKRISEKRGILD